MIRHTISANSQYGATLLVALILLLIMTIVGIGASQVSKMQYQMARNTQFQLDMYQVALSENNAQIKVLNSNNKLIEDNLSVFTDQDIDAKDLKMTEQIGGAKKTKADLVSTFKMLGKSNAPPGFSLGVNAMDSTVFQLETNAEIPNSSIRSNQTQGASILSPNSNVMKGE